MSPLAIAILLTLALLVGAAIGWPAEAGDWETHESGWLVDRYQPGRVRMTLISRSEIAQWAAMFRLPTEAWESEGGAIR